MDLNTFIEYAKLHLISLEQDSEFLEKRLDEVTNYDSDEYRELEICDIGNNGQIFATAHLLSVAEGMLK